MTDEELVGQLIARLAKFESAINAKLDDLDKSITFVRERLAHTELAAQKAFDAAMETHEMVRHLSCMLPDTNPDHCAEHVAIARKTLASMSDDEPDSVLTRQISVGAGPLSFRGPGVMMAVFVIVAIVTLVALKHYLPWL